LTEPQGLDDPEWFVNGVALLDTPLAPEILLNRLLEIENRMGRERTVKWGPRLIDLDVLSFDQVILNGSFLTIPHPYLEKRRFVLEPMAEVAPYYVHPVLNKTIRQLLKELPEEGQGLLKLADKI
jgi:2-amino-4-hydroxy-6-hydroxymethyldihydropteridine diphosphokinase